MPRMRKQYPLEYRRRIVELAREGRSCEDLAREFEPSAAAIRAWAKEAELDELRRGEGIAAQMRVEHRRLKREVQQLRRDRAILARAIAWLQGGERIDPRKVFEFVSANVDDFPIRSMCRVLGSSPSGYYAWRRRPPSARARRDAVLRRQVLASWEESRRTYGRRRIHADLKAQGEKASLKRIARLMHEEGIEGARRRPKGNNSRAERRGSDRRSAPDLVNRNFHVDGPDRLWVADITQVWTRAGWSYVAVILDAWSRMVVGWAAETYACATLVEQALAMAVRRRSPNGVVHHSDRGSQYRSRALAERCRRARVRPSMGAAGDTLANALCESFFATLECELLDRSDFANQAEAETAIIEFMECFYNLQRRHSALGYLAPAEHERRRGSATSGPCPLKSAVYRDASRL